VFMALRMQAGSDLPGAELRRRGFEYGIPMGSDSGHFAAPAGVLSRLDAGLASASIQPLSAEDIRQNGVDIIHLVALLEHRH
jgi:hypothetical protein